jgi:hypothetical protein
LPPAKHKWRISAAFNTTTPRQLLKTGLNMTFNLGDRLLGFRKALAAVQAGDWSTAAAEMLDSQWAAQVGPRAQRLAEAMRTGVMPSS